MSFDKAKAMRGAEKYLAQGKIRAAINEYSQVVEADKTDFSTLNMLGDLYVKVSDIAEAVNCFTKVAEYYGSQGFAQKAIAIYNKISRLNPDSVEISTKLANLYQMKGSVAEARLHLTTVAEQHFKKGKKSEALAIWRQIASLDPNNTDIYLKIADACWQEGNVKESGDAYVEAGNRLNNKRNFESAVTAFSRALEIDPDSIVALRGLVNAQTKLGCADEAAKMVNISLDRQPYNREVMNLLIDCYIDMGDVKQAEKVSIKLVEQEPANYPKLLELVHLYLRNSDVDSAARVLAMASEHLLMSSNATELQKQIFEILTKDPEHLEAIRLLLRLYTFQRDDAEIKNTLIRLAETAKINSSPDDERHALTQLVMIFPQNSNYAERLHELSLSQNFSESTESPTRIGTGEIPTFESASVFNNEKSQFDYYGKVDSQKPKIAGFAGAIAGESAFSQAIHTTNTSDTDSSSGEKVKYENFAEFVREEGEKFPIDEDHDTLSEFDRHNLFVELEGVDFYITQGFFDLAERSLDEIETRFGLTKEVKKSRESLSSAKSKLEWNDDESSTLPSEDYSEDIHKTNTDIRESHDFEIVSTAESGIHLSDAVNYFGTRFDETDFSKPLDSVGLSKNSPIENLTIEPEIHDYLETAQEVEPSEMEHIAEPFENSTFTESLPEMIEPQVENTELDDLQPENIVGFEKKEMVENVESEEVISQEVGDDSFNESSLIEEVNSGAVSSEPAPFKSKKAATSKSDDFDSHYGAGTAYREMGLLEDAIREFQDAIKVVSINDGTKRFFHCCNLLGTCFVDKGMPRIALKWYQRGLETKDLNNDELQGIHYELANVYEMTGNEQKAREYFEEIYAFDVDFRDVGKRLEKLMQPV